MTSQNEDKISDLLEKLPKWSSQEVKESLDVTLPILLSSLEHPEQTTQAVKSIQCLMGICLSCIPVSCVEEKLFQHVLPGTRQLFNEILEHIQISLQEADADDTLECPNGLLQICIELLGCVDSALQYALSNEKLEATLVPTLPKETANILMEAFRHCNESEKIYGSFFKPLAEELTVFFQKSHEVQLHFLALITEHLTYNCIYEDELMMLIEVMEMVGKIGQLIMVLEVKTMAEQWKAYVRLAVQYYEQVKQHLNLAESLQFLAKDLSSSLEMDVDLLDEKILMRKLKVGSFTLKLIIKLCGQYKGYLGPCQKELFELLISLYDKSPVSLQQINVSRERAMSIEQHIIIGAEPLLTHLMAEIEFVENYCSFGSKIAQHEHKHLSFLLLSIVVLKKLMPLDNDVRKLWLQDDPSCNVLYIIVRALDYCHVELNDDLTLPGVTHGGEPARKTDLYEAILTHFAGFVLTVSVEDFAMVEQLLLESLLQKAPWRAILAMDVWCLVARSGSAELCFQHTCHIAKVFKLLAESYCRPEMVFVKKLLGRLFQLLSDGHKMKMVEMFPPHINLPIWEALGVNSLPDDLRTRVTNVIMSSALSATDTFLSQSAPNTGHFKQMVSALAAAARCLDQIQYSCKFLDNLVTLWQCINLPEIFSKEETSVQGCQWLQHFAIVLCSVTAAAVKHMNNIQLIQSLETLKLIFGQCGSSVKLGAVELLRALASKVIEADFNQHRVFLLISSLFSILLQDANPVVQQTALQAFAYFAHINVHEDILVLLVRDSPAIQQQVTRFMQKIPIEHPSEQYLTYQEYLRCQSQIVFTHTCKKARNCEQKPALMESCHQSPILHHAPTILSVDNPPKKIKLIVTGDDVVQALDRIGKDADIVTNFCYSNTLTNTSREALLQVINKLQCCIRR